MYRTIVKIYVFLYQNLNFFPASLPYLILSIYVFLYQNLNETILADALRFHEFMYFYIRI